jgi:hypothetical protein
MQFIFFTRAIAVVVDFSVQNSVAINQNSFAAASVIYPSISLSLCCFIACFAL